MSDDLSIRSELERKTIEEIERLILHMSQGRQGRAATIQGLETLWAMGSGLISRETMDILAQTITTVRASPDDMTGVVRRMFKSGKALSIVDYKPGADSVTVVAVSDEGTWSVQRKKLEREVPGLGGYTAYKAICNKFASQPNTTEVRHLG